MVALNENEKGHFITELRQNKTQQMCLEDATYHVPPNAPSFCGTGAVFLGL